MQLRWMIRSDIDQCMAMNPNWSEEVYLKNLRQRNIIGKVVEHEDKLLGQIIYELNKRDLTIILVVYKGLTVFHMLVDDLIQKIEKHTQRDSVIQFVPLAEHKYANLLKNKGFKASLEPDDYLKMVWSKPEPADEYFREIFESNFFNPGWWLDLVTMLKQGVEKDSLIKTMKCIEGCSIKLPYNYDLYNVGDVIGVVREFHEDRLVVHLNKSERIIDAVLEDVMEIYI